MQDYPSYPRIYFRPYIDSTYKYPPAHGEIVGAGAGGVNGARAAAASCVASSRERMSRSAQRTEMRDNNMNMIFTYGHREVHGTRGDGDRVKIVVRFDPGVSGVCDSGLRGSRVGESGSGACDSGSRVGESEIAGEIYQIDRKM